MSAEGAKTDAFDLARLRLQRFAPVEVAYAGDPLRELESRKTQGAFDLSYSIASDPHAGAILLFVKLLSTLTEEREVVARHKLTYRFVFTYALEHIDEVLTHRDNENVAEVSSTALGLMLSISYATLRGTLPALFAQTPFHNLHLPIRAVADLLQTRAFEYQELVHQFEGYGAESPAFGGTPTSRPAEKRKGAE